MLIIKKLTIITIFTAIIFSQIITCAHAFPDVSAGATILMHADTGEVLFEENSDSQMLIASTTKIMTALVVLEHCDIEENVEIIPEYCGVEGSSMYIASGEVYSVGDLLYGMMLCSGNDAATALACYCGGSIEEFAKMMNEKAMELGLEHTSFENPHGLDAENQYSTAFELAQITREAMKNEIFRKIVSTKVYSIGDKSFMNHNKLLWKYDGAIGVKTGYTMAAGRILVSCAERDGMCLICVTISDPNDWEDHMSLYDYAYENYEYRPVLPTGDVCKIPVISGYKSEVGVTCKEDTRVLIPKDSTLNFSLEIPEFVYASIEEGSKAGKAIVKADEEVVGEFELEYSENISKVCFKRKSPFEKFKQALLFIKN